MPKHHISLHNDIEEIPLLAEFVDQVCADGGVDASMVMSLNLAIEEAVTNVMVYAYPEGTTGMVDVEAETDGGMLTFVISDGGKAFDPTRQERADITLGVEERPIGGLGIFLVREIMDEVAYERSDNRNVLTLRKILKSE